jgi:hypothetical protein
MAWNRRNSVLSSSGAGAAPETGSGVLRHQYLTVLAHAALDKQGRVKQCSVPPEKEIQFIEEQARYLLDLSLQLKIIERGP